MYKKEITYEDFRGKKRTEEYWFNLTKTELIEMEFGVSGGFSSAVKKIIEEQDPGKIMKIFKDLILSSYGVISEDGKRFIKTPEMALEFSQTLAYEKLFMELGTDSKAGAEFVNGIVPSDMKFTEEQISSMLPPM